MLRRLLRSERGYTLVELLSVIAVGTVVVAALFTIIDVTLHQTSRTFTRVDATQRARTTVESIMNELHSACTASGVAPIQANSTASSLIFSEQYGNAASPTAVKHTITFNASTGTLTDGSSSSTRTLLTNVSQSGSTPVFQYYAYAQPRNSVGQVYTDSGGNAYMMLLDGTTAVPGSSTIPTPQPLTTPLSTNDAENAVEVAITLQVGASGGTPENTTLSAAADTVDDSVVMRLTPAANHAGSGQSFGPCQ
jgi:prepilin-type N-terminal cleavage/methylation domain-containing protein